MKLNFPAAEGPEDFVLDMRKLLPKKWGEPRTAYRSLEGWMSGFWEKCHCCWQQRLMPLLLLGFLSIRKPPEQPTHEHAKPNSNSLIYSMKVHPACAPSQALCSALPKCWIYHEEETLPLPSKRLKLKEDAMTKVNRGINCHKSYNKVSRC